MMRLRIQAGLQVEDGQDGNVRSSIFATSVRNLPTSFFPVFRSQRCRAASYHGCGLRSESCGTGTFVDLTSPKASVSPARRYVRVQAIIYGDFDPLARAHTNTWKRGDKETIRNAVRIARGDRERLLPLSSYKFAYCGTISTGRSALS